MHAGPSSRTLRTRRAGPSLNVDAMLAVVSEGSDEEAAVSNNDADSDYSAAPMTDAAAAGAGAAGAGEAEVCLSSPALSCFLATAILLLQFMYGWRILTSFCRFLTSYVFIQRS